MFIANELSAPDQRKIKEWERHCKYYSGEVRKKPRPHSYNVKKAEKVEVKADTAEKIEIKTDTAEKVQIQSEEIPTDKQETSHSEDKKVVR